MTRLWRWLRSWRLTRAEPVAVVEWRLTELEHARFHVVLSTDAGAVARQFYEQALPRHATLTFWDGGGLRGRKT